MRTTAPMLIVVTRTATIVMNATYCVAIRAKISYPQQASNTGFTMRDFHQSATDFVLGMTGGAVASAKAVVRQTETIESVLRTELVAIWQRDELPLEIVFEKIEEMERKGWEATLEWLGHFYMFESYRYMWDMTYV